MDGDDGATSSTATQAFVYAQNLPHLQYYIITPHVHQSRSGSATLWSEATYDTIRASRQRDQARLVAIAGQEVSTISSGGHWNLFNANVPSVDHLMETEHADDFTITWRTEQRGHRRAIQSPDSTDSAIA
jgi:hypothetical protein